MRRFLNFIWVRNELLNEKDIGEIGLMEDPKAILIDPIISSAIGNVIQSIEFRERASHFSLLINGSAPSRSWWWWWSSTSLSLWILREREWERYFFLPYLTKFVCLKCTFYFLYRESIFCRTFDMNDVMLVVEVVQMYKLSSFTDLYA